MKDLTAKSELDANYLPLIDRYGGIWPFASIGGKSPLTLYSKAETIEKPLWITATFKAAGAEDRIQFVPKTSDDGVVKRLTRK